MDSDERKVDGNAVAGLLGEIFPFEMTTARTQCAACGTMEPTAMQPVYVDAPGMVMRCVGCDSVLIRIVHGGGRYWLDMRGVAVLQIFEA